MPDFAPNPPTSWDPTANSAQTIERIDAWLGSDSMLELVRLFGGELDTTSASAFASNLQAFAQTQWDYRRGSERDVARRIRLDDEQVLQVMKATRSLGLAESAPPLRDHYDTIIVLGGLIRGCIIRPRHAAQLVHHELSTHEIVGLAGFRHLSEPELAIAGRLGVHANDEFGAMTAGIASAFAQDLVLPTSDIELNDPHTPSRSWRRLAWPTADAATFDEASVVAAPTTRPGATRANTRDAYHYWANELRADATRTVLAVTHPIYVPYQGSIAIETLGLEHGLHVETIGVTAAAADLGPDTQQFEAQDYLQELLSSINGLVALRSRIG